MFHIKHLIMILLFTCFSWQSLASSAPDTDSSPSTNPNCQKIALPGLPVELQSCFYPSKGENRDLLYFFHGIRGSATDWESEIYFPHFLRQNWEQNQKDRPNVLSLSFGPEWFLARQNESPLSGLYEVMIHLLPSLEVQLQKQLGIKFDRRMIMGPSMGGVNTILMSMKGDIDFDKVAILCAQMAEVDPFGDNDETLNFLRSTKAYQYHLARRSEELVYDRFFFTLNVLQNVWPTPHDWERANPLNLAKELSPSTSTQFYLTTGIYDPYANYEGNLKFLSTLKENNIDVEWRELWSGHCEIDIKSLAEFLVN